MTTLLHIVYIVGALTLFVVGLLALCVVAFSVGAAFEEGRRLARDRKREPEIPGLPLDTAKEIHRKVADEMEPFNKLKRDVYGGPFFGTPPAPKASRAHPHLRAVGDTDESPYAAHAKETERDELPPVGGGAA